MTLKSRLSRSLGKLFLTVQFRKADVVIAIISSNSSDQLLQRSLPYLNSKFGMLNRQVEAMLSTYVSLLHIIMYTDSNY